MKGPIFFLLMILLASQGHSQNLPVPLMSNIRTKKIPVIDIPLRIDSLTIVPETFSIAETADSSYSFNAVKATIQWLKAPGKDSVTITYRVFPPALGPGKKGYDYDSIRFHFLAEPMIINNAGQWTNSTVFDMKGLQSEGSIGRFLSFGNAQDAVVNSSLNLQLHGYVADSLELTAAITDNNIPFQPDGDTRDLRDFDRIFIQARKKNWQVSLGDIDQRYNGSHFLGFYKRLQGAAFSSYKLGRGGNSNQFQFAGAVAKGKFSRNNLTPEEGNQGPYRLQGANNELYFVILSGTERVYIDGELLERGEDRDYVINYNTAELRFTPRRLIQKDRRIQVEFEYADRNYLNAQLFVNNQYEWKNKISLGIAAYSNTDARNSTIDQPLDGVQKEYLASIGDSMGLAFYKTEMRESYTAGKILYIKKDTVYNGNTRDTIYVLSADSAAELYSVAFSYLGPGKGDYRQLLNVTNGKAFEWVQPDATGHSRGEWAPVSKLVTPKKQQILTAGIRYRPTEKTDCYLEGAVSIFDMNLFSAKDKFNDDGKAFKLSLKQNLAMIRSTRDSTALTAGGGWEQVQETFRPVERLRSIEFLRDWSLPFMTTQEKEVLNNAFVELSSQRGNRFKYEATSYNRGSYYNGFRHLADMRWNTGKWTWEGRLNQVKFQRDSVAGSFFRPSAALFRSFQKWGNTRLEMKYTGEFNRETSSDNEKLINTSFSFEVFEIQVRSDAAAVNPWSFSYFRRQDAAPDGSKFSLSDKSDNWAMSFDLLQDARHQLKLTAQYRNLHIVNNQLTTRQAEQTLLSRTDYAVTIGKGLVNANFFYEFGNAQELKREFAYIQVPAGQGEFTWIDYNNNGIEELNEFEKALFQDQKKYIRVYTPGNTYVKANYLQFNYSLDINPKNVIRSKKGFAGVLAKSNLLSVFQSGKKQIADGKAMLNPFAGISDSNLVSMSGYLSNTFYFNRIDPRWGLECTHSLNTDRSLLVYGLETRRLENLVFRSRLRIVSNWVANLAYRMVQNELGTSGKGFSNRNFNIHQQGIEPSLTYTFRSHFRMVLGGNLQERKNRVDSMERSNSREVNVEIRYNASSGTVINLRMSMNEIKWKGSAAAKSSTVGYQMLNGLQPGKNFLWTLDLTKRLGNNLEMNIQYEGRKPDGSGIVHIGRAGIRALF